MDEFFEILKIILPALIVFLTAFYLIKKFFDRESQKRLEEIRMGNRKTILPIRLQAYERIVLYLERIAPNSIVMRIYEPGMSAKLLQAALVKAIRDEFEHNMSQQIYVSEAAWIMTKQAKEETIKLINISAGKVKPDATGIDLSQVIFELAAQLDKLPSEIASSYLKKEIQKHF
jgi:hypothetical protein